jgi:hypothetical protein
MRRPSQLIIFVSLCQLTLAAQNVRIEGNVVDADTGVPISGAKAVLRYVTSPAPLETAATDATGAFQFSVAQPGKYAVELSAQGFEETLYSGAGRPIEFDATEFGPGADETVRNIVVKIPRSGGLHGRIRDAESREPIRLLTVRALRSWWLRGKRQLKEGGIAFTDDGGVFQLDTLPAGEYVLEVHQAETRHSLNEQAGEKASTKRYPLKLWPVSDPENVAWIQVQGGVETDVGIIDYAKAEPASVRGLITSGCHPENGNQILLYQILGGASVRQISFFSPCDGKPFSIPAAPGTYRLSVISVGFDFHSTPMLAFQGAASAEKTPRSFGTVEFHVVDGENREVEIKIFEGGRITGRVTCECRTPLGAGPERTGVRFNPLENMGLVAAFDLNAEGTFEGWASMWGPTRVEFLNLPQDLYVKKIAVDGRETGPIVAAPTWRQSVD